MARRSIPQYSLPPAALPPAESREARGDSVRPTGLASTGAVDQVAAATWSSKVLRAPQRARIDYLRFTSRLNRSVSDESSLALPHRVTQPAAAAAVTGLRHSSSETTAGLHAAALREPFFSAVGPPGSESAAASAPAPGNIVEEIFEIEVDNDFPGIPAHGSLNSVDSELLSHLASNVAIATNSGSNSVDRQLRYDVTEILLMEEPNPCMPHEKLLSKVADGLRSKGHEVETRTTSGSYIQSTAQFTLRHSFLLCNPKGSDADFSTRIVDLTFKDQFGIACPSPTYELLLQCVPDVFVGSSQSLQAIVQTLSSQITESFQMRAMPTPPWRRIQALYSKWFPVKSHSSRPLPNFVTKGS